MTDEQTTAKHVLIIDDDTDLCDVLKDKLANVGYTVSVAHNGADGEKLAFDKHPDLILLDVMMPDKTGHEVLEALRGDAWGNHAKVILLTNVGDLNSISNAVSKGTTEYLVKTDWSLNEVVEHVNKKINEEAQDQEATTQE